MTTKESEKFVTSNILEGMTSISALLKSYEKEKNQNNRKIIKILYNESKIKNHYREFAFLKRMSELHGFSIETVSEQVIEENTIGNTHGGVIAVCSDRTIKEISAEDIVPDGFYFMLEGIEDPYNFGYSLRSLYAAGVDGIILSPRNWMGAAGVVARASAGASELLDMYISEPLNAIEIFKNKGYKVYCADKPNSVSIYETEVKKPLLVIVGGEKRGNSKAVLENSDKIIHIDYGRNFGAALSAASASTVIAFEVMRQNLNK
ncbi:MAG: RNA methyltransferase [Ruminococcaceae bacterium]|nr:RNA methyltransferase [Oscillospiraceae bacterium]